MYNLCMLTSSSERLIAEHIGPIAETLRRLQQLLSAFGQELSHAANPAVVFESVLESTAGTSDSVSRYLELDRKSTR